jgi:hypothetical protein
MIVRGTSMWARVLDGSPNDLSGKYQVDICNLDENTVTELTDRGITIKNDEDRGDYVTAKAPRPPRLMDASKRDWNGANIGNGSIIKISAKPYPWNFKGKSGVGLGLNQLMVVEHVEYTGAEELEAEAEAEVEAEAETDFDDDVEV